MCGRSAPGCSSRPSACSPRSARRTEARSAVASTGSSACSSARRGRRSSACSHWGSGRSWVWAPPPERACAGRTAAALVQTLAHFGIDATIVGQISGPRVTRYELQLAPGTKVSKVAALKDDLSYALATTEIRILAPIPGKQAVGVEIPNLSPNLVTLGDIFDDLPATASPLAVWLGKDISGTAVG